MVIYEFIEGICEIFYETLGSNTFVVVISMIGSFCSGFVGIANFYKIVKNFRRFLRDKESGSTDMKANAFGVILAGFIVFQSIFVIGAGGAKNDTEEPVDNTLTSTVVQSDSEGEYELSVLEKVLDFIDEFIDKQKQNTETTTAPTSTTTTTTTTEPTTTTTTESTTQEDTTTTEKESSTTTETTTEVTTEPTTMEKQPDDVKHLFDKSAKNALLKEAAVYDMPDKGTVLSSFSNSLTAADDKKDEKIQLDSDSLVWLNFGHTNLSDEALDGWVIDIKNAEKEEILVFKAKVNELNTTSEKVFLPKGEYTICVSSGYYYSEEEYNITVYAKNVQSCEKERNDNHSVATLLEFVPKIETAVTYGLLASEEDQDFYMFDMSENGHISIKFEHKELEKDAETWDIELYEVYEETLVRIYEFKSRSNQVEAISSNIGLNKGRYFIRVAESNNYSSEIYALSVCCLFEDEWEAEPNDTDSYAKSIYEETRYYGNINETESEDYYRFTCEETGSYLIEFSQYTPEGEDKIKEKWGLKVLEGQKKTVLKNTLKISYDEPCIEGRFEFNKGETYYIRISGERNNKGTDYCFIIEKVD